MLNIRKTFAICLGRILTTLPVHMCKIGGISTSGCGGTRQPRFSTQNEHFGGQFSSTVLRQIVVAYTVIRRKIVFICSASYAVYTVITHKIGFMQTASYLVSNPSISEILWEDLYGIISHFGQRMVHRTAGSYTFTDRRRRRYFFSRYNRLMNL